MSKDNDSFPTYKGLQKPLVFKSLKGRYIYWGLGVMVGSLISCVVLVLIFNFLVGGICLVVILFGGLSLIAKKQKNGLYSKKKHKGIYIISQIYSK